MAERISDLTNHISQDISPIFPGVSQQEVGRAIHASLEDFARRHQLPCVVYANSPRGLSPVQQPASERTRMVSELGQSSEADRSAFSVGFTVRGHYRNEEPTAAFSEQSRRLIPLTSPRIRLHTVRHLTSISARSRCLLFPLWVLTTVCFGIRIPAFLWPTSHLTPAQGI